MHYILKLNKYQAGQFDMRFKSVFWIVLRLFTIMIPMWNMQNLFQINAHFKPVNTYDIGIAYLYNELL